MAKDHNFYKPVNFWKNAIKNAKLLILDRTTLEDDDVIDKKYVDDQKIYDSELSQDVNSVFNPVQKITDPTKIQNKDTNTIFDELFYPLINHSYIKPTSDVDIVVQDTISSVDLTGKLLEVGTSIKFDIDNIVDVKDSLGLVTPTPYEYNIETEAGVQVNQSSNASYLSAGVAIGRSTTLYVVSKYQQAALLKDSHGVDDPDGTAEFPKFIAGQLQESLSVDGVWPIFVSIFSNSQALPTNLTLMSDLESAEYSSRIIQSNDTTIDFNEYIDNVSGAKTFMVAVVKDKTVGVSYKITCKKNNEDISSLFTIQEYVDVPDASGNGFLEEYIVFRAEVDVVLSNGFDLQITTNKITA